MPELQCVICRGDGWDDSKAIMIVNGMSVCALTSHAHRAVNQTERFTVNRLSEAQGERDDHGG